MTDLAENSDFTPPPGFAPMPIKTGYDKHVGPLFMRKEDDEHAHGVGLLVCEHHLNPNGFCHGGALMSLADVGLGSLVWRRAGYQPCATLTLNTDFIGNASVGDFIICEAEITRQARSVTFVQGLLKNQDGKTVMSASGVWKMFGDKK